MRRLFIQDSESPHTFPKLLVVLLGIVVSLIILDWLFGLILPGLTIEPPFILRLQNVQGVERLWAMNKANIQPIVFTGSSQMHMGVSPHIFDEQIKMVTGKAVDSVNVSIWGSVSAIQHDLIANLILPNHPQVIIYGIEMRALLPAAQNGMKAIDFWNKPLGYAVASQSNLERNVLLWLMQNSNLFRYRDNLREWLTTKREINHVGYSPTAVDDMGYFYQEGFLDRNPEILLTDFIPFTASEQTNQLMSDIGTTCKQNGVQCILLNLPLHEMAYQYIKPEDISAYQSVLKAAGLPIWDFDTAKCRTILGDASFYNPNHLNAAGAETFSKWLADVYAQVFFSVPVRGDAACADLNS
jgi:hypothetical protein